MGTDVVRSRLVLGLMLLAGLVAGSLVAVMQREAGASLDDDPNFGTLVIIKDAVPDDPENFTFTSQASGAVIAVVDDDDDASLSNTDSDKVVVGTYGIEEDAEEAWDLTAIDCSDPDGGTTTDLDNRVANVDIDPQETVTCTFTNTKRAAVTITKSQSPHSFGSFLFTGDFGNFTLNDGPNPDPTSRTFFVSPGSYDVSEFEQPGWQLVDLDCDDPDGGTTTDLGNRTATIDADVAEEIECTFTNHALGSITIVKDTEPDDPQDFSFSGDLGPFTLDDDADPTEDNTITFSDVKPGFYNVTEDETLGWRPSNIECDDDNSSGDVPSAKAAIVLDPDEDVICTFTNSNAGVITIEKQTNPVTFMDFEFTGDLGDFLLDGFSFDDEVPTSRSVEVGSGVYQVAELVPDDWGVAITCDDPDGGTVVDNGTATAKIDLDGGEEITCVFLNTQLSGTIRIQKSTDPDGDPQDFLFTTKLGNFTLDTDGPDQTYEDEANITAPVGTHIITEVVPEGWTLDHLECQDPDDGTDWDTESATVTIDLDPGELVSCFFLNLKPRGTIRIHKFTDPDNDPQDFEFKGDLGTFFLDTDGTDNTYEDEITFSDVPAGVITVTEQVPDGWRVDHVSCQDVGDESTGDASTATATIVVQHGELVDCFFENTKPRGTVRIHKFTDPDGDPEVFEFSGDLGTFYLDTDGTDGTYQDQADFHDVPAGEIIVTELVPPGWRLDNVDCTDPDDGTSTDTETAKATIDLDHEEIIDCAFFNSKTLALEAGCEDGTVGKAVQCEASASVGPPPYAFSWDIDKDGSIDGTGESFKPVFDTKGSHVILVTVVDAAGDEASENIKVWIDPQPLDLTASCADGTAGKPVRCEASATGGTQPYTFEWDVDKDGSIDGSGAKVELTFSRKGDYTVDAIVTDDNGAEERLNLDVHIDAQPLEVEIKVSPAPAVSGEKVTLSASISGGSDPYSCAWDIGKDGTTDSTDCTFSTSFPFKGEISVGLTVTDDNGVVETDSAIITVEPQCADVDGDGLVGARDIVKVARLLGTEYGDARYDEAADVNRDGIIDLSDLLNTIRQLGRQC